MKLNVRGGREIIWLIFAGLVLYVMIATGEKFKLAYFNARGEAEIIRLIFAVVGVVYEDARITQKIWEEIKSDMPMKSLPVLTIDEDEKKIYGQSGAIAKYLARKYGLHGHLGEEDLVIDEVYESVCDVQRQFTEMVFAADEIRKKEAKEILVSQLLPTFNSYFEQRRKLFGNSVYLIGDKLTLADLAVFNLVDNSILMHQEELWTPYPALLDHRKLVMGNSNLMSWLKKRPVTEL